MHRICFNCWLKMDALHPSDFWLNLDALHFLHSLFITPQFGVFLCFFFLWGYFWGGVESGYLSSAYSKIFVPIQWWFLSYRYTSWTNLIWSWFKVDIPALICQRTFQSHKHGAFILVAVHLLYQCVSDFFMVTGMHEVKQTVANHVDLKPQKSMVN